MNFFKMSDYIKGFFASLSLHAVLVYALFFYAEPIKSAPAAQQKAVTISLNSFIPVQVAPKVTQAPPLPTVKKVVEKKVRKTKPQHKKHAKHHKPKKHKKNKKEHTQPEVNPQEKPKIEELAKTEPIQESVEKPKESGRVAPENCTLNGTASYKRNK